jgi:hypothetical protein
MENLKNLIKNHGDIKKFLDAVGISRNFFYAWRKGQKRMSLQMAARIVKNTQEKISYEDLADFEKNIFIPKNQKKIEKPSKQNQASD